MKRDEILETAAKIVTGGRNKQYREPEDNSENKMGENTINEK